MINLNSSFPLEITTITSNSSSSSSSWADATAATTSSSSSGRQQLLTVGNRMWGNWWDGRGLLRVKIYDFAIYIDTEQAAMHLPTAAACNGRTTAAQTLQLPAPLPAVVTSSDTRVIPVTTEVTPAVTQVTAVGGEGWKVWSWSEAAATLWSNSWGKEQQQQQQEVEEEPAAAGANDRFGDGRKGRRLRRKVARQERKQQRQQFRLLQRQEKQGRRQQKQNMKHLRSEQQQQQQQQQEGLLVATPIPALAEAGRAVGVRVDTSTLAIPADVGIKRAAAAAPAAAAAAAVGESMGAVKETAGTTIAAVSSSSSSSSSRIEVGSLPEVLNSSCPDVSMSLVLRAARDVPLHLLADEYEKVLKRRLGRVSDRGGAWGAWLRG